MLVVIPGNPGDVRFYETFVAALRARGHEVLLSAHPEGPTSLVAYAQHHAEEARKYVAATKRDVVLVGHSVGAYLAYLIVANEMLPVASVCMLFPFLARPQWKGRLVLNAVAWPPLFNAALATVRALPSSWKRRWLERTGAGDVVPVALDFLERGAEASAAMARIERREIASRPDASYVLGQFPLVAFHCDHDRWAPRGLEAISQRLPVSHGFVAHAAERALVVEALDRFL